MDERAMLVAEDLEFDMAGLFDVAFDQQRPVAECAFCFSPRRFESLIQTGRAGNDPHAPSASTGGSFHQDGKLELVFGMISGYYRDSSRGCDVSSRGFHAHAADGVRPGAHED